MKIRDDFVTNSSSTSFIFGKQYGVESIETIYNLIRMICNELVFLYKKMQNDDRMNEFNFDDLKDILENEYICNSIFCVLNNLNLYKYFISFGHLSSIDIIEEVAKYNIYGDYLYNTEYDAMYIYDIHNVEDFRYYQEWYTDYAYPFFGQQGLDIDKIDSIVEKNENKNFSFYKDFLIQNIGHIILFYADDLFCPLFDITLKYFSNYALGVAILSDGE